MRPSKPMKSRPAVTIHPMVHPDRLLTTTLQTAAWGAAVTRVLSFALQAVDPRKAVADHFLRDRHRLIVGGREYALGRFRRVYVVGAGKAGLPMAEATLEVIGERVSAGLVIVKEGYAGAGARQGPVQVLEAGHPLPDARGVQGSRMIVDLLAEATDEDLVICLISGGGSALLTYPAEGVTLNDLRKMTVYLLASGAAIDEFNTLRKHLDRMKGGGLAHFASPATVITLILSDVVGNSLETIASGPTVSDSSTFADSYAILERYSIVERVPQTVRRHLERGRSGELPDTPKPGDPMFGRVHNVLVATNQQAAQAACEQAEREGLQTLLLTTYLQGEAREVGHAMAAIARQMALDGQPVARPGCVVLGGETTVTVRGDGLGGRNQELALGAVTDLDGLGDVALVTLATDGGDGPTDAAGAVVNGETLARARALGLDPHDFLARNDAYHFFEPLGDLLKPGPTQTNVNDLALVFAL